MNIYHIQVLRWDGDYWLPTDEAVVVKKSQKDALAVFEWARKMNVSVKLLGKAARGVDEGIVIEKHNYRLTQIIDAGAKDKRALIRAAMLDL